MGEGKIGIIVKNGKVAIRVKIGAITQDELAMLITNIELIKLDFLSTYKKSLRRFNKNE